MFEKEECSPHLREKPESGKQRGSLTHKKTARRGTFSAAVIYTLRVLERFQDLPPTINGLKEFSEP